MNQIGIKQGRLSPRPYPKLQAFPSLSWRDEFPVAKEIGYDYIEWMFDAEDYENNPLWTEEGRQQIRMTSARSGLPVSSVCADFFLARPFYREEGYTFQENVGILRRLIKNAAEVGAINILLPVLEAAEIRDSAEEQALCFALESCVPLLEEYDMYIGLETELEAHRYLALCQKIGSPHIGAYYDTGNAAACGYAMETDITVLMEQLICIHIKDRTLHGGSVFLGMGDVNFEEGMRILEAKGYKGNFTLEAYYEDDPVGTASKNLLFLREQINKSKGSIKVRG